MVYLLAATSACLPLLKNAVWHLKQAGVRPDEIVAYSPDIPTASAFWQALGTRLAVIPADLPAGEQLYRHGAWGTVVKWKLRVLQHAARTSDCLYIDPDVVVFEDLRRHLPPGPWEVCLQTNGPHGGPTMGVVGLRRTVFAADFVAPPYGPIACDDPLIQSRWDVAEPRLALLDVNQFPVGCMELRRPPALCYHFNFVVGMAAKIARMKAAGVWHEEG
jgi:hypothetical protein